MLITRDKNLGDYEIKSFEPSSLKINDDVYTQSVIISSQQLDSAWPPQTINELTQAHIDALIELNPDIILLGTGSEQVFPNMSLFSNVMQKNIGFEIMSTLSACRTFNILMSEGRNAIAGLIIR